MLLPKRLRNLQRLAAGELTVREFLERDPAIKDVDEEMRRLEAEKEGVRPCP